MRLKQQPADTCQDSCLRFEVGVEICNCFTFIYQVSEYKLV